MLRDYESVFDIKTNYITSCFVISFTTAISPTWSKNNGKNYQFKKKKMKTGLLLQSNPVVPIIWGLIFCNQKVDW